MFSGQVALFVCWVWLCFVWVYVHYLQFNAVVLILFMYLFCCVVCGCDSGWFGVWWFCVFAFDCDGGYVAWLGLWAVVAALL